MKRHFQKILISVVCAVLAMPAWGAQKLAIKVVDSSGKAVSGAKVTITIYNGTSKYKEPGKYVNTGSDGRAVFPDNCNVFKNGSSSGISIKVSKSGYEDGFVSNFNAKSDCVQSVTLKTVAQVVADKKKEESKNCATSQNDASIADIASCVNWGTSSAWKKSGTCKTSGNKNGECKAVDSGDKNYQAKKDCWIIVGSSRLYLPKPDGKNIYRCVATQKTETSTTTISVSGRVVDAETNEGLPNANLKMVKSNNSVIPNANCQADIDGKFSCKFDSMPTGAKLQASYTSYNAQSLVPKQDMLFKLESTETKSTETKSPEKNNPGQSGTPDISTGNGENNQPQTPDDAIQPVVNVVPEIPVVVAPKPATMTGDTIIKSLAVRLALDNDAPSQMDKNKFADLLGAADNISIREILIACIKSMPADIACNQCEAFIRSMVNYHNNN